MGWMMFEMYKFRKCRFRQVRNHIFIDYSDNMALFDITLYGYMSGKPLYELHIKSDIRIIGVDDV
jgi:hypothetical protein